MKYLKLFLAHILIFALSNFIFIYFHSFYENTLFEITAIVFHLALVIVIYIGSGYYATTKTEKFKPLSYSIIVIIGICIWLIAFIDSPTDLNWKNGNGGLFWLLYRIYIIPTELPFCFSDYVSIDKFNIIMKHISLVTFTILPSIFQAYGGFLKTKRNIKPA